MPPTPLVHGVRISHPQRVIDAASGATKLELARFYDAIAAHLLPHLKARPVALLRAPEGTRGELIFQRHRRRLSIAGLRELDRALDPGHAPPMVVERAAALVGAAQMGMIELHTWNAVSTDLERPDRLVFDLDPGEAVPWARVLEAAELTRRLLDELGLASFVKTSGSKGLHVVVPIRRQHGWQEAAQFAHAVSQHLAATLPQRFVARPGPQHRVGKVFVDYLRNSRGATSVSAFSARARPMLPVSVPLAWEELAQLRHPGQWTIRNLHERLHDLGDADPWAGYAQARRGLAQAMRRLGRDTAPHAALRTAAAHQVREE